MTETGGLFGTVPQVLDTPQKKARPKSKPDRVIQFNCEGVCTYARCETTSNTGELRPPRSIKKASPFRRTMADYICSSSYILMSPGQDETRVCGYIYIYIYIYIYFT